MKKLDSPVAEAINYLVDVFEFKKEDERNLARFKKWVKSFNSNMRGIAPLIESDEMLFYVTVTEAIKIDVNPVKAGMIIIRKRSEKQAGSRFRCLTKFEFKNAYEYCETEG